MTDLEIVQTAADRVVSALVREVYAEGQPPLIDYRPAKAALDAFQAFATELQRLRDQVYPR